MTPFGPIRRPKVLTGPARAPARIKQNALAPALPGWSVTLSDAAAALELAATRPSRPTTPSATPRGSLYCVPHPGAPHPTPPAKRISNLLRLPKEWPYTSFARSSHYRARRRHSSIAATRSDSPVSKLVCGRLRLSSTLLAHAVPPYLHGAPANGTTSAAACGSMGVRAIPIDLRPTLPRWP